MKKGLNYDYMRQMVLSDPATYKQFFDWNLDAQNVTESVEFLTELALKLEDDVVELPTPLAVAAVLVLKGLVKRPQGKPRDTHRRRREKMVLKLVHSLRPEADPMIVWARARMTEIKAEAKAKDERIKADKAREDAAKEAKAKFKSKLSWQQIAERMRRPGRYAPKTQPR